MDLLLFLFFAYRNGARASRKGENAIKWGLLTLLCCFATFSIGLMIVLVVFHKDVLALAMRNSSMAQSQVLAQSMVAIFQQQPSQYILVILCGVGGFLFIHYLLGRKPDKDNNKTVVES